MDNVWATLHTALFLAHHEKWDIDILYLIKKIIFTSFADLILSDINSGTKSYIKKLDETIFEELYKKAYEHFLGDEAPEILKQDFRDILETKDKYKEDSIFLAAKKYVGFFEASVNPLAEMKKELTELSSELPSLKELMRNTDHEKYLAHIYRLSFSMRWNQYGRNTPISVMSHKVIVAYLSYIIWTIGNEHGENNDITEMFLRAIYHDVPEVITGDIITPTKKAVPGFVELLEKVEKTMMDDYLYGYISEEYKDYLNPYILHPFDDELGKKVKYADVFSALIEAKVEDRWWNTLFHEKYQTILAHISHISHPGVEFLLKETLFHFDSQADDTIRPSYD